MQTILVTGGGGFIGSCLVRHLMTNQSFQVINLDKLTYAGNLNSLVAVWNDARHIFIKADISDREKLGQIFTDYSPQAVINLAAESHVDRSIDGPQVFVQTNVMGTFQLLEAARSYWNRLSSASQKLFRFLHVSTDEVFGSLGETGSFTESSSYAPNSPYSASKASSDHFVRAYYHTYGLPTVTTNCSNNYGPYQFPEKLIPLMILNALDGKPLPVYGDGLNVRDWLYVEDHVLALCAVLERGVIGETYNIGGRCEKTNLEVVHTICSMMNRICPQLPHVPTEQLITRVNDRPGHDRRYAMDSSKIETDLGWFPTQTFETGLERTIRWYLDNREWVEQIFSGAYQRERLGMLQEGAA